MNAHPAAFRKYRTTSASRVMGATELQSTASRFQLSIYAASVAACSPENDLILEEQLYA